MSSKYKVNAPIGKPLSCYRVRYESIISHYEEMPHERLEELQVDMDLDATRQCNWGAATVLYLYYGMDLYVRGAHLKVGYRRIIEIWACEHQVLPMSSLYGFDGDIKVRTLPQGRAWRFDRRYAHTTSEIERYPWGRWPHILTSSKRPLGTNIDDFSFSACVTTCTTSGRGLMSESLGQTGGGCHMKCHTTCCLCGLFGSSRTLRLLGEDRLPLTIWLLLYPSPMPSLCRLNS
ncbi:hypothetical protein JCGZ_05225 [Jatropha curcas]|uniref:Aminotransferase-like plant mobile domain-containing protein n=1 Tax=Jatropha curcas TaxID=180498 RepID=A0A067KZT8_JATCU|nr:hypothetical protein JCGZ_05225 [Jatropha curcas]